MSAASIRMPTWCIPISAIPKCGARRFSAPISPVRTRIAPKAGSTTSSSTTCEATDWKTRAIRSMSAPRAGQGEEYSGKAQYGNQSRVARIEVTQMSGVFGEVAVVSQPGPLF